jgi:sulfoxide reductase catalytic subunit YedY
MSFNLLLNPFFSLVRTVQSKTRKILLPIGTARESLKSKNPRDLDTSNLELTPLNEFRTMGLTDHVVDREKWRLEVTGNISKPLSFDYSQIVNMPSIEKRVLLICPGIFANHGKWRGICMKSLLAKVQSEQGTTYVTFYGPKGRYEKVERFPIQDVLANKVFLAYAVNGGPLPQKHGFPLRIVAEDYYGDFWVKYVYKMKLDKI